MTTMVEKVARAIYEARGFSNDSRTVNAIRFSHGEWEKAIKGARAAIEAMMEPTEEAWSIAREERGFLDRSSYSALIQACLKEDGQ